jgi:hypothetical protein
VVDPDSNPLGSLIADLRFHPDGTRAVVRMLERRENETAKPSLVVAVGWEQEMIRRLRESAD